MVVGVEQRDWELLNQQLRGAGPPQTGLAGVVMFAVFFSGLILGTLLTPTQNQTLQIASRAPLGTTLTHVRVPVRRLQ